MKKNQKMLLLGGAVLAAIAGIVYYNNEKKKKANASGGYSQAAGLGCRICENPETNQTYFSTQGSCRPGGVCVVANKPVKYLASA
jgi:hypothetical protein